MTQDAHMSRRGKLDRWIPGPFTVMTLGQACRADGAALPPGSAAYRRAGGTVQCGGHHQREESALSVTRVLLSGYEPPPGGIPASCPACGDDLDLHEWFDVTGDVTGPDAVIAGCDRDGAGRPPPAVTRTARLATTVTRLPPQPSREQMTTAKCLDVYGAQSDAHAEHLRINGDCPRCGAYDTGKWLPR